MTDTAFETLLAEARTAHSLSPELSAFCDFPVDLIATEVTPHIIPPTDVLAQERNLTGDPFAGLRDAFCAAGPYAKWRETYWETDIAQDFKDRFGCYCLIGPGGAWSSETFAAFVVYMPPRLYYPWHHHPAEELYLVIGGSAEFHREGEAPETLVAGQSSFHSSNQRHAMETHDLPVMAYVVWRNEFETPPVWSDPALR